MKVSDPKSPSYGQYWSRDKVIDYFGATDESVAVVSKWLKSHGISDFVVKGHRDFISGFTKASTLEKMLQIEMHVFQHGQTQQTVVRSLKPYSVPIHVAPHIAVIGGIVRFPSTQPFCHSLRP